jgi:hypothetical protein
MTPPTIQRATFQKYRGSDTRAVVDGVFFNFKYDTGVHCLQISFPCAVLNI